MSFFELMPFVMIDISISIDQITSVSLFLVLSNIDFMQESSSLHLIQNPRMQHHKNLSYASRIILYRKIPVMSTTQLTELKPFDRLHQFKRIDYPVSSIEYPA